MEEGCQGVCGNPRGRLGYSWQVVLRHIHWMDIGHRGWLCGVQVFWLVPMVFTARLVFPSLLGTVTKVPRAGYAQCLASPLLCWPGKTRQGKVWARREPGVKWTVGLCLQGHQCSVNSSANRHGSTSLELQATKAPVCSGA